MMKRVRHPEKVNLDDKVSPNKPNWIKVKFSNNENKLGLNYLKSKGWKEGEPFICLLVRDNSYLNSISSNNWSYHAYRDSDVNDYELSVNHLTLNS